MKNFFKSHTFIALCILSFLMLVLALSSLAGGGKAGFLRDFSGILVAPIQKTFSTIAAAGGNFSKVFTEHKALANENEKLKKEVAALSQSIRTSEKNQAENDELRKLFGIAKDHEDLNFEIASVMSSNLSGYTKTLTLDKGKASGLSVRDLVMTPQGVVGYISEIGTTWAIVTTILDSSCELGVVVTRTGDYGILEGTGSLSKDGLSKMSFLSNTVTLNIGDSVETSGVSGLFPAGIFVGRVRDQKPEVHGISQYAVIEPSVDCSNLSTVFVVTSFSGKEK